MNAIQILSQIDLPLLKDRIARLSLESDLLDDLALIVERLQLLESTYPASQYGLADGDDTSEPSPK
jgi:hypothetical protein